MAVAATPSWIAAAATTTAVVAVTQLNFERNMTANKAWYYNVKGMILK